MKPILGQEAVVPTYGLGRVTQLPNPVDKLPNWIGVTPYVAGYQMNFDVKNVRLVAIGTLHQAEEV